MAPVKARKYLDRNTDLQRNFSIGGQLFSRDDLRKRYVKSNFSFSKNELSNIGKLYRILKSATEQDLTRQTLDPSLPFFQGDRSSSLFQGNRSSSSSYRGDALQLKDLLQSSKLSESDIDDSSLNFDPVISSFNDGDFSGIDEIPEIMRLNESETGNRFHQELLGIKKSSNNVIFDDVIELDENGVPKITNNHDFEDLVLSMDTENLVDMMQNSKKIKEGFDKSVRRSQITRRPDNTSSVSSSKRLPSLPRFSFRSQPPITFSPEPIAIRGEDNDLDRSLFIIEELDKISESLSDSIRLDLENQSSLTSLHGDVLALPTDEDVSLKLSIKNQIQEKLHKAKLLIANNALLTWKERIQPRFPRSHIVRRLIQIFDGITKDHTSDQDKKDGSNVKKLRGSLLGVYQHRPDNYSQRSIMRPTIRLKKPQSSIPLYRSIERMPAKIWYLSKNVSSGNKKPSSGNRHSGEIPPMFGSLPGDPRRPFYDYKKKSFRPRSSEPDQRNSGSVIDHQVVQDRAKPSINPRQDLLRMEILSQTHQADRGRDVGELGIRKSESITSPKFKSKTADNRLNLSDLGEVSAHQDGKADSYDKSIEINSSDDSQGFSKSITSTTILPLKSSTNQAHLDEGKGKISDSGDNILYEKCSEDDNNNIYDVKSKFRYNDHNLLFDKEVKIRVNKSQSEDRDRSIDEQIIQVIIGLAKDQIGNLDKVKLKKFLQYLLVANNVDGVSNKKDEFSHKINILNSLDEKLNLNFEEAKKFSRDFQEQMKQESFLTGRLSGDDPSVTVNSEVGLRTKRVPTAIINKIYSTHFSISNAPSANLSSINYAMQIGKELEKKM